MTTASSGPPSGEPQLVRRRSARRTFAATVLMLEAFVVFFATLVAFDFAGVLGGAVVTETVFGWAGMGKLFTNGLSTTDPNPVMAFFLVTAVATVLFNMLADIAYAFLDPRIRLR